MSRRPLQSFVRSPGYRTVKGGQLKDQGMHMQPHLDASSGQVTVATWQDRQWIYTLWALQSQQVEKPLILGHLGKSRTLR